MGYVLRKGRRQTLGLLQLVYYSETVASPLCVDRAVFTNFTSLLILFHGCYRCVFQDNCSMREHVLQHRVLQLIYILCQ